MMVAMLSVGFVSCGSDDENSQKGDITADDPDGTVIVNLSNNFYFDGKYYNNGITFPGLESIDFGMTKENNLRVGHSVVDYWDTDIVSVGKVNGLSGIKTIPSSGWGNKVAAVPGNGYIIRGRYDYSPNIGEYKYVRVYVVNYTTNISEEIIGVTIKYHSPWIPISNN